MENWEKVRDQYQRDLQERIDSTVEKIRKLTAGHWQLFDMEGYKSDERRAVTQLNNALARSFKNIPKYGVLNEDAIEAIILERMNPVQLKWDDMGAADSEADELIRLMIRHFFESTREFKPPSQPPRGFEMNKEQGRRVWNFVVDYYGVAAYLSTLVVDFYNENAYLAKVELDSEFYSLGDPSEKKNFQSHLQKEFGDEAKVLCYMRSDDQATVLLHFQTDINPITAERQ